MTEDGPLTPDELERALRRFFGSREERLQLIRELCDRDAVQEIVQITKAARIRVVAQRLFSRN